MSRSARLTRLLGNFIESNSVNYEILNPENLRFATLNDKRLFPTLYFEDKYGCKGRIRQNHIRGPLLYFSDNDVRLFFTEDVDDETKRKIAFKKENKSHFGPPRPKLTNFIVDLVKDEATGDLIEIITPIPIKDLGLYPDHSELYEFDPHMGTMHLSGGSIKRIKDVKYDTLTQEVLQLRTQEVDGTAVMTAAINSFYLSRYETVHVRSGDTNDSLHLELCKITPEELSSAINGTTETCEAVPSSVLCLKKSPDVEEGEIAKTYTAESAAMTLKPSSTKKRKF